MSRTKFMEIANSYMGVKEIRGSKHNPVIMEFFQKSDAGWVKDDETPWCAAFVNAVLHEAGYEGTGSLAARSFLKWGKRVYKPRIGDIVVFWRKAKNSWEGHVGFYVREEGNYVYCLGGNQSNKVSVVRYPKSRVLQYREPSQMINSRTTAAVATGAAATASEQGLEALEKTQSTLLGAPIDWLQYVAIGIAFISLAVVLYARFDDMKQKGR